MARLSLKFFPTFGAFCTRLSLGGLLVALSPSLGHLHWLLDLLTHFQIQAALALTLLLTSCLALKQWRASGIIAAILTLSLFRLFPLVNPAPEVPSRPGSPTLSITTLNVLSSNPGKSVVSDFLHERSSDLVILSETTTASTEHLLSALPEYPYHFSHPREDNFGALILSKWPLSPTTTHAPSPYAMPLLEAVAETPLGKIRLFGTHPIPPVGAQASADRNTYLAALGTLARESDLPVVIAGDLNTTRWSAPYKALLKETTLHDLADGQGLHPTWKPFKTGLLGIPIDHLLASPTLVPTAYEIDSDVGSDHYPVTAVLQLQRP